MEKSATLDLGTVKANLGALDPAAQILPRDAYRDTLNADLAQNPWTIHIFVVVLLIYVVIAALNTLIMAGLG